MAHVSTTTGSVVRSLIAAGHAPEDADWAAVVRFALRTAAKA